MWRSRKITGSLGERSWATTLVELGVGGKTGQLTVKSEGKSYELAFADGKIVGASSPAAPDAMPRIALATRLLPPPAIAAAVRIMGRTDNPEKFTEAAGLSGADAVAFHKRVLLQRAARTFALERGEYVFETRVKIPVLERTAIDVRAAVFHGMRMHLSETRLATELRRFGARFILYPEAAPFLEHFELEPEAAPITAALRGGTSVSELEALHRELDPRLIHAVLGALAACNVITPIEPRRLADDISISRVPTPREPTVSRVPTLREPMVVTSGGRFAKGSTPSMPHHLAGEPFDDDKTVARPAALSRAQVQQLIASRIAMLQSGGVDLFAFLGLPFDAPIADVRAAYLEIARYLRPERLGELGIVDSRDEARTVYAQAVIAMTTLTDVRRRADYLGSFRHVR